MFVFFLHLFPIEHSQDGCISFKETPLPRCLNVFAIVMYVLERSHDSDPTPAIFSPISTMENSEPLVLLEVGVVRSHSETSGVVWSRLESPGDVQSRAESSGVVQSRAESSGVGVVRSRQESELFGVVQSRSESTGAVRSNVLVIRHFVSLCFFVFHFACAFRLQAFVAQAVSGRLQLQPIPSDTDFVRLRTTLSNSRRLQMTLDSGMMSKVGKNPGSTPILLP